MCPHCGLADEDAEHRFWTCPAWDYARAEALSTTSLSAPQLRAKLPRGTLLTGALPLHDGLSARADAAALDDFCFPQAVSLHSSRTTVWTDGACLHPADPLLARAAWGLRADAVDAVNFAGPVGGCQTAQRAEVAAVVAASLLITGDLEIVTDSKYVVTCCARLLAGDSPSDWEHADLWRQLEHPVRSQRLSFRWVKAHMSCEDARARGMSERDRLGNAAADSNAGAAALQRLPSNALLAERAEALLALDAVQRLLGAVQLKVMQSRPPDARRPQRRCWANVRRGQRGRAASMPPAIVPQADPRSAAHAPRVVPSVGRGEALRLFFEGRSWQPHSAVRGPGFLTCLRCGCEAPRSDVLMASACAGWSPRLPPRAWGLLILGGLRRVGGSAASFEQLVRQRLAQLPAAPD